MGLLEQEDRERRIRDGLLKPTFYVCPQCNHIESSYDYHDRCSKCHASGEHTSFSKQEEAIKFVQTKQSHYISQTELKKEEPKTHERSYPYLLKGRALAERALANVRDVRTMMRDGPPKIEWVVENLIPRRGITVIGADAGTYKTYLAQHLSMSVACGLDFLEKFTTQQANVLYIDEENGEILLMRRFAQLAAGHEIVEYPENLAVLIFEGIKLDTEEGKIILQELVKKKQPGLIILDSMVRLMEGEEDKSNEVRKIFDNLKDEMESSRCAFVILHHTRKDERRGSMHSLRGSGDFAAMADVVLMLNLNRKAGTVSVSIEKHRHLDLSQISGFDFRVSHNGPVDENVRLIWEGVSSEPLNRTERCIASLKEWLTTNQIMQFNSSDAKNQAKLRGHSSTAYDEARKELAEQGIIFEINRGVYGVRKELLTVVNEDINFDEINNSKFQKLSPLTAGGNAGGNVNFPSVHPKGPKFEIKKSQAGLLPNFRNHKELLEAIWQNPEGINEADLVARWPGSEPSKNVSRLLELLAEKGEVYENPRGIWRKVT